MYSEEINERIQYLLKYNFSGYLVSEEFLSKLIEMIYILNERSVNEANYHRVLWCKIGNYLTNKETSSLIKLTEDILTLSILIDMDDLHPDDYILDKWKLKNILEGYFCAYPPEAGYIDDALEEFVKSLLSASDLGYGIVHLANLPLFIKMSGKTEIEFISDLLDKLKEG